MASGDTLAVFTPQNAFPHTSSPATLDTVGTNYAEPVLDFDADAGEFIAFKGVMPNHYAGGGVTVSLIFAMSSDHDPAHKVRWDVYWSLIHDFSFTAGVQAITGDGWAASNSVSQAVNDIIARTEQADITFTDGVDMDSVEANDGYLIAIGRDHDHEDDDATGDAELWAVIIKET